MHTSKFQIAGYEGDVVVFHNGDWSGEAIIEFQEAKLGIHDKQKYPKQEVTIPAKLLAALALPATQEMVSNALVIFAERLPETLGLLAAIKKDEEDRRGGGKKK